MTTMNNIDTSTTAQFLTVQDVASVFLLSPKNSQLEKVQSYHLLLEQLTPQRQPSKALSPLLTDGRKQNPKMPLHLIPDLETYHRLHSKDQGSLCG